MEDILGHCVRDLIDKIQEQEREIRKLKLTLADRKHLAKDCNDPPEVVRSLGFWPDCGCGECYAIHCLDEEMKKNEARS